MSENILLDSLPETVEVNGKEFFIDTDFRTCIIFEKILESDIPSRQKVDEFIGLFFPEGRPDDLSAATEAILHLYRCGDDNKPVRQRKRQMNGKVEIKPQMIYNYEYDAPYIFGAFYAQYGIDLNEIEFLHWWKFQALFKSLEDHNKIVEIMGYRATDLSKIENKKERERIARLKQIYALPQNLSFEDKVAMAGAAFGGGFM